jgi:hypothetical protein|tara:strand:+ start:627 stop:791 length:165 start_codon:yes stop_codon:yes gene_type:complete
MFTIYIKSFDRTNTKINVIENSEIIKNSTIKELKECYTKEIGAILEANQGNFRL